MNQPQVHQYYRDSTSLPPSGTVALARFNTGKHYFTDQQLRRQQAIALQPLIQQAALEAQKNLADPAQQNSQGKAQKPKQKTQSSDAGFKNVPKVPQALKPPTIPGQGSVPGGSLGLLPKNATGSYLGDYGHYINKFYNPWSEAWKEESTDGIETGLKYTGRAATAIGTTAAAAAGGLGLAGIGTTTALGGTGAATGTGSGLLGGTLGMSRGLSTIGNLFSRGANFVKGFGGGAAKAAKPPGAGTSTWNRVGQAWNWADRAMTADYLGSFALGDSPISMGLGAIGLGSKNTDTPDFGSAAAGGVDPYGQYDNTMDPSSIWNQSGYGPPPAYGRYNPDNWSNLPANQFSPPSYAAHSPTKTASSRNMNTVSIPVIVPTHIKVASQVRAIPINPMPIIELLQKEAARLRGTGRSGRVRRSANPNNNRGIGNNLVAPSKPQVNPTVSRPSSPPMAVNPNTGLTRAEMDAYDTKGRGYDSQGNPRFFVGDVDAPLTGSSANQPSTRYKPDSGLVDFQQDEESLASLAANSPKSQPSSRSGLVDLGADEELALPSSPAFTSSPARSTGPIPTASNSSRPGTTKIDPDEVDLEDIDLDEYDYSTVTPGPAASAAAARSNSGSRTSPTVPLSSGGGRSTSTGSTSAGGGSTGGGSGINNNNSGSNAAPVPTPDRNYLELALAGGAGAAGMAGLSYLSGDGYDDNIIVTTADGRAVPLSYYTKREGSWFNPSSWGKGTRHQQEAEIMRKAREIGWLPPNAFGNNSYGGGGGNYGGGYGNTRLPTSLYSMTRWPDPRHYRDMVLANRGGVQQIQQPTAQPIPPIMPVTPPTARSTTDGFKDTLI